MNRLLQYVLLVSFCIAMYSVPIVQAVVELKRGESVQFFDVLEDTFITPLKKNNDAARAYRALREKCASTQSMIQACAASAETDEEVSAGCDYDELALAVEEVLYAVQDIRKIKSSINRHIAADTTATLFNRLREVSNEVRAAYEQALDEAPPEEIATAFSGAMEKIADMETLFGHKNLLHVPPLAFDHFFRYTAFNRRYLRAYENEMEETSVFANTLRPPMQFLRYMFMKDVGEKAINGKNGWLFYNPGVDYLVRPDVTDIRSRIVDSNDRPFTENPYEVIVTFRDQLRERGVELLVVIVPAKPTIYPDLLNPEVDPDSAGRITHSLRMIETMRSMGIDVVNLFGPFAEARKRDPEAGDSLYLRTDTHWRARGVRLAAKLVAARVRQYPWAGSLPAQEYVIDSVVVDRVGDIGVMTKLPVFRLYSLNLSFPTEKTTCYQVFSVRRGSRGEAGRTLYRDDFRRARILVLGDSFSRIYQTDEPRGAGWIAHLAYELQTPLGSIVSDGGASTLVRQRLARKSGVLRGKRLVVWEFVERDFRHGAEGWKHVELD